MRLLTLLLVTVCTTALAAPAAHAYTGDLRPGVLVREPQELQNGKLVGCVGTSPCVNANWSVSHAPGINGRAPDLEPGEHITTVTWDYDGPQKKAHRDGGRNFSSFSLTGPRQLTGDGKRTYTMRITITYADGRVDRITSTFTPQGPRVTPLKTVISRKELMSKGLALRISNAADGFYRGITTSCTDLILSCAGNTNPDRFLWFQRPRPRFVGAVRLRGGSGILRLRPSGNLKLARRLLARRQHITIGVLPLQHNVRIRLK